MNVSVVIPALNEAQNIAALVRRSLSQDVQEVIVVDNGSADDTGAVARQAGAVVVTEPRRGYGFACQAGALAAVRAEAVLFLDGDHSSSPDEMPRLLNPLRAGAADLVLGSRMLGQIETGAMPPQQLFGNWLVSAIMRRLYKLPLTDLGPYRAITRELLLRLDMREMTFGYPTEMMVKAARRGARLLEVPVNFYARRAGKSKVSGTVRGTVLSATIILGVTFRYAFGEQHSWLK